MSVTLTDAAGTPVDHVFSVRQSTPDLTIWHNTLAGGGVPVGFELLSLSVKENQSGTTRVTGKLVLPAMEVADGDDSSGFVPAPTKAYECIGTFELVFPGRSTLQNRKDLRKMLGEMLATESVTTAAVETLTRPTG